MPQNIRKFANGLGISPKSSSTADTAGEMEVLTSDNRLRYHDGTSVKVVTLNDSTDTLTNKTIDASSNTISNIVNANISASANIALSKLAALTASRALNSDGSGVISVSSVTSTELGYLSGVTSAIQTQLDGKQATGSYLTALTGDVTATGPGSAAATITANAVSNSKLSQMAQSTIKGREASSGTGDPVDLTATQATAILDAFTSSLKGLVPASGGGTTNFLRADGSWAAPSGGTTSPLTTKGDLWGYSTLDARIPVGSNDQVLTADSTQALGVKWATPSSSNPTFTGTAGETLATNDAVYISAGAGDAGRTAGSIYKLDATNPARSIFLGFVTSGVSSGNTVTIQTIGELSGFTGLTEGQPVYGSISTPGSYQTTQPTTTQGVTVIIGWGSTATTKLLINGGLGIGSNLASYIAGYDVGGYNTSTSTTNTYQKLTFASEATGTLSTTVNVNLAYATGVSSTTKGYTIGGFNGGDFVNVWVLTFANETSAAGTSLPSARRGATPTQSTTAGYAMGGNGDSSIAKYVFSTNSTSNISATLSLGGDPSYGTATTSPLAGYATSGSSLSKNVTKLTHSSDTTANLVASTSVDRKSCASNVQSTNKGYYMGNASGSRASSIEAITFSSDAIASISATLSVAKGANSGCSSNTTGYSMAGDTAAATTGTAVIEKLNLATETTSTASNTLPSARQSSHGSSGLRY